MKKENKLDLFKLKTSVLKKNTVTRMKSQAIDWEKTFTKYRWDRRRNKNIQRTLKIQQKEKKTILPSEQTPHQKTYTGGKKNMKRCSTSLVISTSIAQILVSSKRTMTPQ